MEIKKVAQDMIRKLEMSRTREATGGFNWNQISSSSSGPVQSGSNQFQNSNSGRGMFIENDEKPIDWSSQDRGNYVELPTKKLPTQNQLPTPHIVTSAQTGNNRINTTTWSNYKHQDEEEKPKTYGVEDTPGMTPREQSPMPGIKPDPDNPKSGAQSAIQSGYNSGIQSGARTPACYQATPLVFSRNSTPESIEDRQLDLDKLSESDHDEQMSGQISPSDIPDSPGQFAVSISQNPSELTKTVTTGKKLFETPPPTQPENHPIVSQTFGTGAPPPPLYPSGGNLYPQTSRGGGGGLYATTNQNNAFPSFQQNPNPPPGGGLTSFPPFSSAAPLYPPPQSKNGFDYYQTSQGFPAYNACSYDMDDDGPTTFADEGSMSPRSRTALSEMTIDSAKNDITHEPIEEETNETTFFDTKDVTGRVFSV